MVIYNLLICDSFEGIDQAIYVNYIIRGELFKKDW